MKANRIPRGTIIFEDPRTIRSILIYYHFELWYIGIELRPIVIIVASFNLLGTIRISFFFIRTFEFKILFSSIGYGLNTATYIDLDISLRLNDSFSPNHKVFFYGPSIIDGKIVWWCSIDKNFRMKLSERLFRIDVDDC